MIVFFYVIMDILVRHDVLRCVALLVEGGIILMADSVNTFTSRFESNF